MDATGTADAREWTETVTDLITDQPIEVRFRKEGERVWYWPHEGDGRAPAPHPDWIPIPLD